MHRSLFSVFAAALIAFAGAAPAVAQVDEMDGPWQQIASNAGICPKCRISIDRGSSSLTVTANNGWSASLIAVQNGNTAGATGAGRWQSGLTGAVAGKRFTVDFVLRDQRLIMSMLVEMGNGSRRTIRAVYGRVWLGA
jgi:hypothetical protein